MDFVHFSWDINITQIIEAVGLGIVIWKFRTKRLYELKDADSARDVARVKQDQIKHDQNLLANEKLAAEVKFLRDEVIVLKTKIEHMDKCTDEAKIKLAVFTAVVDRIEKTITQLLGNATIFNRPNK